MGEPIFLQGQAVAPDLLITLFSYGVKLCDLGIEYD